MARVRDLRLGHQIPSPDDLGVTTLELFERAAEPAVTADESGFDAVVVNDHVILPPIVGSPEADRLECYTLQATLAARARSVESGATVTANRLPSPAMLAPTVTTFDVVSGGRATPGMGANGSGASPRAVARIGPPVRRAMS